MTNLIVDVNNFVFSLRHSILPKDKKTKERFVAETLFKSALVRLSTLVAELKADAFVICVDSPNVWRRDVYPEYKANHTGSIDDPYFDDTIEACNNLVRFFRECTAAYVLEVARCEADDIIGVWCQESDSENIILSSDKDFIQLINDHTRLYSPVQKCWRETEDAGFDLFVKCIRGDAGDHVPSAYPRVRVDRLRKAWSDDLEMLNLLETILPGRDEKVADTLMRNIELIDLTAQPEGIRQLILEKIKSYQPSAYSQLKTMKFLSDIGIKDQSNIRFIGERAFKKKPSFKNI
jgi:hypothetical protein